MKIYAMDNYYNRQLVCSKSSTSFKGELTSKQYITVLERLKKVNSAVDDRFSTDLLDNIINSMVKRYECLGVKSVALQIISKRDLPYFLGDKASNYDLKDKIGICIAVDDKRGPIESMTNIYDAHVLLAKEDELSKLQ